MYHVCSLRNPSRVHGSAFHVGDLRNRTTHKLVCYKEAFAEEHGAAPSRPLVQREVMTPGSPLKNDVNVLVFLHGVGDTEQPFVKLATAMQLPQTTALCLRAPLSLPLGKRPSNFDHHAELEPAYFVQLCDKAE